MLSTQKGAMFGLDARIALAIFGGLSVITGAVLYKVIQQVKVTSAVATLNELSKAVESYMLDTGQDLPQYLTSQGVREITDLISNAYPDPKDAAKKKAALKKVSMFKKFNKEVANKFGFNQVLDHPLSYDFITKTSQGADPSELIRVRPLPDRVNTFKSFLESAKGDPRDVMWWAEYENRESMDNNKRVRDFNKSFKENGI